MILKVIGWKEGADVTDLADMSTLEILENKDVFIIKRNMYEAIAIAQKLSYEMEKEEMYDSMEFATRLSRCCYNVLGQLINKEALDRINGAHMGNVNVSHLLNDIVHACKSKMRNLNINLLLDCDDNVCSYLSAECFVDCVMNLIINSAQNLSEEGGTITIKIVRLSENSVFSVSDNGFGMEKGILEKLLNNKKYMGGLSIVKRFCDLIGSKLIIDTNVGEGFMASFRLPLSSGKGVEFNVNAKLVADGEFSPVNIYLSKIRGTIPEAAP